MREEATQQHLDDLFKRSGGVPREDAPTVYQWAEDNFAQMYGTWRFNQVIGWIRLYALGSQVRGELWFVQAKQIRRDLRDRRMAYRGKAFELPVLHDDSSTQIFKDVMDTLQSLSNQPPFKGRHIDLESFENLGPYVDWRQLICDTGTAQISTSGAVNK